MGVQEAKPSQAKPSQAKPSQAKPSQAKPSQAKTSQATCTAKPAAVSEPLRLDSDHKVDVHIGTNTDAIIIVEIASASTPSQATEKKKRLVQRLKQNANASTGCTAWRGVAWRGVAWVRTGDDRPRSIGVYGRTSTVDGVCSRSAM
jgi:hypothetical protein